MKKAKKNKKEKKEASASASSELSVKVQPSVSSATSTTPSSSDAPVHKTKAKKDKNNKTKQITKQDSVQSIENNKEIEEAKECPFQSVFETVTASKPKKQRKRNKITKEDSFVSEDVAVVQAERKVIDVEIKPKDNKEKRSKAEKKKLAANCSGIDDKSQV